MKSRFLAQGTGDDFGTIGGPGLGPFGEWVVGLKEGAAGAIEAMVKFAGIISNIIGVMTIAAGLWFLFQFIIAGFGWLTSGGDKNALAQAQDRMRNAFIGLVIVVTAIVVISLTGKVLGLDILITDPKRLIEQLKPPGV